MCLKCLLGLPHTLMRGFTSSFAVWCFSILFIASVPAGVTASNATNYRLFTNLTLCALNGSSNAYFKYLSEAVFSAPILSQIINQKFKTTASFIDTACFTIVAAFLFADHTARLLGSIYACIALMALSNFAWRFFNNCRTWRYACTRFTSFILTTKGAVIRYSYPYLLHKQKQVLLPDGTMVEPKHILSGGRLVTSDTGIEAELWA
ncbi:glycoprotein 5 [Hedgehog arterivirus]|nr:glycoprotein 5 [Hedgehog arterivirus]